MAKRHKKQARPSLSVTVPNVVDSQIYLDHINALNLTYLVVMWCVKWCISQDTYVTLAHSGGKMQFSLE